MTSTISKSIHQHFLKHPALKTSTDKYLKWIPYAAVFVLDIFKIRTRSGLKKQVLVAGLADGMRYVTVDSLKKITKEHRPFPFTGHHSFPSGHTSSSFAGAEFLHKELKDALPILSYAGYVAATVEAVIRLEKNRHWLIDVVAGAAIGVLSAKLAYLMVNRIMNGREKKKISAGRSDAREKANQYY